MSVGSLLESASIALMSSGIPTSKLDAILLLCSAINRSKSWVIAHPEYELSTKQKTLFDSYLGRRLNQEPISYILGSAEFYGRSFFVTKDTLQPRPETETMIEMALSRVRSHKNKDITIVDVGTGSGCIAVTMALELPQIQVTQGAIYATDISEGALEIARQNSATYNAEVRFYHGDLLEPVVERITLSDELYILANLPYVPTNHPINAPAKHEPASAIFGGVDGLDYYRDLFAQTSNLEGNIHMLTESLLSQHDELVQIALAHQFQLIESNGLIQCFAKTTE